MESAASGLPADRRCRADDGGGVGRVVGECGAGGEVARRVTCVPADGGWDERGAPSRSWKRACPVTVAGSRASLKVAVTVMWSGTPVLAVGGGDVGDRGRGRCLGVRWW